MEDNSITTQTLIKSLEQKMNNIQHQAMEMTKTNLSSEKDEIKYLKIGL
jgi:hypothetical protein